MTAVIQTDDIMVESSTALTEAQAFKITTADEFVASGEKLKGIKALAKKIDDTFDPHIKRAFEAHRSLVAEKKVHQTPLQTAEALIKRQILSYQQEEERKRLELEAQAQEAARKEREKLEARAEKAAASGKTEKAEALHVAAASVVTPIVPTTTPKVAGISTRVTYRAEVVDKLELVKAVAAGAVPLSALDVNQSYLNAQAKLNKESLRYPGVKVVQETGLAARGF